MRTYTVEIEDVAEKNIESAVEFLMDSRFNYEEDPGNKAYSVIKRIVDKAKNILSNGSVSHKPCQLLVSMGVHGYQELIVDGYKFIYKTFSDRSLVSIFVIAHQRQDLERLLVEYCLK